MQTQPLITAPHPWYDEATPMAEAHDTVPIEELLLGLADGKATGTLVASAPLYQRRLFLVDGELVGIASTNPREWLGHFLVGSALLSEEQLDEALQGQEGQALPLGKIIEQSGAIDRASLDRALRNQATEVVLALFHTPAVERHFAHGDLPDGHPLGLRIALPRLVVEGLRRRIRLREIEECLGGLSVVPRRTAPQLPPELTPTEERILARTDGSNDLEAIALACHLVPFRVAEFVLRGVEAGFLAVTPKHRESDAETDTEILQRARKALADGRLKDGWDLIRPLRSRPTDRGTFDQIEDFENRLTEALLRRRILGHLVPHALPPGDETTPVKLEPAVAYTLSRVNGCWTLRQIQRTVPLEELHFGVIVDDLVHRQLVELRHPEGTVAVPAG